MCTLLVICKDDADGLITAAAIIKKYRLKMLDVKVVMTSPYHLDTVKVSENVRGIFIANIHINKRNAVAAKQFIEKHLRFIVCWVDNYRCTANFLEEMLHFRLSCNHKARSSAAVLENSGYDIPRDWVIAANAANTNSRNPGQYPSNYLSERYKKAYKAALIDNGEDGHKETRKVQEAFLKELLEGTESEIINHYQQRYEEIIDATRKEASKFKQLLPKVGVILLNDERVDKDILCREGYKLFPIIAIQFHSCQSGQPMTIIAAKKANLDLNQIFGLRRSSNRRVYLPGNLLTTRGMIERVFYNEN